jgi:hypothetical protein
MRNKYTSLWIWLLLCPLALDYKSTEETASHVAQILMVLPTIGAGLTLTLIAPRFLHKSHLRSIIAGALLLTILGSIVTQVLQGNDFSNYLHVLLPFLLFLLGYLAACHPWQAQRLEQFERAMFWAMVVSLLFTFVYGMDVGGTLNDVRFRIVSATFLGLQGILLHEFVVAKRFTLFTLILFLCTVIIEFLSVTRSLLVGTVLLFGIATWLSVPSVRQLLKAALRAMLLTILIGGLAAGVAEMFPEVATHWTQRIFVAKNTISGRDPTTITRLAEMKDQYDQVTSSPQSLLAGKGFGHFYRYSPYYLPDLAGQINDQDFYAIKEWVAGHNFWVYMLFAGGLIFGIGLPLGVLYALYRGVGAFRTWRRIQPDALYLPVMGRAILLLAGLPAVTIGGNPLGPRFSGLVFGVALGLVVAMHSRFSQSMRGRAPQAASPPQPTDAARSRHAPRFVHMHRRTDGDQELPAA